MVIGNCYPSQLNCTKSIEEFVWRKKGWPCIYNPSFNFYLYLDSNHPTKPKVNILGSGNDYTAFMHIFGVPFIDIRYSYQEDIGFYSLYHTLYEKHYFLTDTMNIGSWRPGNRSWLLRHLPGWKTRQNPIALQWSVGSQCCDDKLFLRGQC
jgi:hypothetical protein